MEKHVLSDQTDFLLGHNLSLPRQMTCLLTKIISGSEINFFMLAPTGN